MSEQMEVEVVARTVLAEGVVQLTLRAPDGGDLPHWEPGAHLDLYLAPDLVRQYSLCGDPLQSSIYQVAVLLERPGRGGSSHVHQSVDVGRRLRVGRPRNSFEFIPGKQYLFIAGGIGITPILPMLAQVSGAEWKLVYGGRTRASMAFLDRLTPLENVEVRPQDETGLLDLDALLATPEPDTLIYCCGPESLLAAVEQRCAHWPSGSLRVERFAPKVFEEPDGAFEVEFAQSGVVVGVGPGQSIVDVAAEAGVQIETSCREGTCGTCESPVLEGIPEHRDSLLTPDEQAANDVMFPCVSRARSPRLVIDR